MAADQNRVKLRPNGVAFRKDVDERAGARTWSIPTEIPGLREFNDQEQQQKKAAPRRPLPKHLRIMKFAPPKPRPKSAAADTLAAPPPLAADLERAGLGHYARKLCDDMSATTVDQLLALDRPRIDALIDALRPVPGHRVRLLNFLRDQRALRQQQEGQPAAQPAAPPRPHSAIELRKWKASVASLGQVARRGKDGPLAHSLEQQPLPEGHAPPRALASPTRVRVISVAGGGKMCVFDGPRPNAPSGKRTPSG
jgi:hypothetical protein